MSAPEGGAAFILGATGGLGQAICHRMAQDWPTLAIGYRSSVAAAEALCAELAAGCSTLAVRYDLRETATVQAAVAAVIERFGSIGCVVFASGVAIRQPFVGDIAEHDWGEVIDTELMGFARVVAATLPHFRERKGGCYVALTSMANYSYPSGDALSSVPKAGIESLGRAIAKEEGRNAIRANMVAPGIIDAGLGAAFLQQLYTKEIWQQQRRRTALRRFGEGAEVAEAVAFLASSRASYITGQTLLVDGGFSL